VANLDRAIDADGPDNGNEQLRPADVNQEQLARERVRNDRLEACSTTLKVAFEKHWNLVSKFMPENSIHVANLMACVCTVAMISTLTLHAQDEVAPPKEVAAEELELEDGEDAPIAAMAESQMDVNKMAAARRFQLTQIFLVEVEELTRICELNKKQNKKLRIGAKGAVKKLTTRWKEENEAQMQAFGQLQPANATKKKEESEIEIKDASEVNAMTWQMVTMNMSGGNPFRSEDPTESKFWRKTVSNVLTDSQSEKFDQFNRRRDQAKQTAMIQYTLTLISVELGLSDQQATELDKLVRPIFQRSKLSCPALYESYVMTYYASKADEQKMKTLLSPAQLQKWKIFIAPLKQVGAMIEMNNGGE